MLNNNKGLKSVIGVVEGAILFTFIMKYLTGFCPLGTLHPQTQLKLKVVRCVCVCARYLQNRLEFPHCAEETNGESDFSSINCGGLIKTRYFEWLIYSLVF